MAKSPAAERRLTEPQIRALLSAQAPELADLPLTRVAEEWDNVIWRLGDALALRMPRREIAAGLIGNEQRALPHLAGALDAIGIRTPRPQVNGTPTAEFPWPWSIVPWFDGTSALRLPRAANARWAPTLAQALAALHVAAPDDAPRNPVRGVPLRDRDASIRARLARLPEHPALEEIWIAGLREPPSDERVWIHGDLHPGNVIVDDGGLAAIIDFGDVTAGDPAYDLASAWMLFDADGRRAFRGATGGRYSASTWRRARAWAGAVTAILLSASDDRPALHRLGEETEAELSAD